MINRQLIIVSYLLVILTSVFMAPVCAAENIPVEPSSNVYYPHLWYSSDIGGYLDPARNLHQQFSPYSSSLMNMSGYYHLHGYHTYDLTTKYNTLADSDLNSYKNHVLSVLEDSIFINSTKFAEGAVINRLEVNPATYSISFDFVSDCKYLMYLYFNFYVYFDIDVPVGSFTFADKNAFEKDPSIFSVNVDQVSEWAETFLVPQCNLKSVTLTPWGLLSDITYKFPTNVITDKLVYSQKFSVNLNDEFLSLSPEVNVKLDSYNLGNFVMKNFEGVIESNFDYALNANNINYQTSLVGFTTNSCPSKPVTQFTYNFTLDKLIPVSSYSTSGGESYGTWQSKSCQTFDFVCHLGNGLGYLIYEFPLTSSITKLVAPIGEFFIKSFDFLEGFSSIGVAYGVIFTMIMISVIMFLVFGK